MRKTRRGVDSMKKIGIADAHGIESYKDYKSGEGSMVLFIRAETNRQRHAVVYVAEVSVTTDNEIQRALTAKNYIRALRVLKAGATGIGFPKSRDTLYRKSWSLIPNPKLDPWR